MTCARLGILLLMPVLGGGGSSVRAANLVVNPSFEVDLVPNDLFLSGTPSGWTGVGGSVDILDAGYSLGTASDGQQFVDLIGGGVAPEGGPFPTGIEQTLLLVGGVTYSVQFDYNGDASPSRILDVQLGSLLSDTVDASLMNAFGAFNLGVTTPWATYGTTVTPGVSGSYTLRFTTAAGSFGSPYLDNVVVEALPGAVPEAGTGIAGSTLVLGAALWVVRRRSSRLAGVPR